MRVYWSYYNSLSIDILVLIVNSNDDDLIINSSVFVLIVNFNVQWLMSLFLLLIQMCND